MKLPQNRKIRRFVVATLLVSSTVVRLASSSASATTGDCGLTLSGSNYLIRNLADFQYLSAHGECADENLMQTGDIDMSGVSWKPPTYFRGQYDGGYHTIRGFDPSLIDDVVNNNNAYGLFNTADAVSISNLNVEVTSSLTSGAVAGTGGVVGEGMGALTLSNISVTGNLHTRGWNVVGSIVGSFEGDLVVSHCTFSGTLVNDGGAAGGLVGGVSKGGSSITDSRVNATISNVTPAIGSPILAAGGLIGGMDSAWVELDGTEHADSLSHIARSSFAGSITSPLTGSNNAYIGGLVGGATGDMLIEASTVNGNLSTTAGPSGGIIGRMSDRNLTISDSTFTGSVTGKSQTGGLVGVVVNGNSTIRRSSVHGPVSGTTSTGGLVGAGRGSGLISTVTIDSSEVRGNVVGTTSTAGLVGDGYTVDITNSSIVGGVTGASLVGGLVGSARKPSVINSHVTGDVVGTTSVGGLIGSGGSPTSPIQTVSIERSSIDGDITGTLDFVGGLVGHVQHNASVADSEVNGNTTGNGDGIGGLVGEFDFGNTTVEDSHVVGNVMNAGNGNTGGLIGYSNAMASSGTDPDHATIRGSSITGNVTGGGITGGLVGLQGTSVEISASSIVGNVVGVAQTGGLVGFTNTSTISTSSVKGNVTGGDFTGGMTGGAETANFERSSVRGTISGQTFVGGLAGRVTHIGITNSYFNGGVSGVASIGGFAGSIVDVADATKTYAKKSYIIMSSPQPVGGDVSKQLTATAAYCVSSSVCASAPPTNPASTTASLQIVTTSELRSMDFLVARGWSTAYWCIHPLINDGYPILRNVDPCNFSAAATTTTTSTTSTTTSTTVAPTTTVPSATTSTVANSVATTTTVSSATTTTVAAVKVRTAAPSVFIATRRTACWGCGAWMIWNNGGQGMRIVITDGARTVCVVQARSTNPATTCHDSKAKPGYHVYKLVASVGSITKRRLTASVWVPFPPTTTTSTPK